nr:serine/threonine-protein kinase MRCK alpha isoform X1 [Ciona intestinalis]XP_026692048.1 serine/threonine-protein kinase MRCK alpha isoform X1 [Ciona intestinalis]|eukprot:XP_009860020.1 serine/threonine-protein kinase MRCK alpha isoform X1 [Ciona intestinalis]
MSTSKEKTSVNERLKELDRLVLAGGDCRGWSIDSLLDLLIVLYDECCNSTLRKEKSVSDFIERAKPFAKQLKESRLHRNDFEFLKVIGRGAFGEVALVRMKENKRVFAMKTLNKWEMLKRAETACFREERDVLVKGNQDWITRLHYAFQDDSNLYLVMDYYVGGDLLTLLSKFDDKLPEDMARFYIAEMVLAIDSIHKLNYVHRDIKPDNVLLDVNGHIRLADFGSCLKLQKDGTVQSNVAVGTPDYISPEILQAMEDGKGRYGSECDWWSLGVCMYEMFFGETPFYAESLVDTYGKIMNYREKFRYPPDFTEVSDHAKDLMSRLVCDASERLGTNGVDDFKNHPFFHGIDWENLTNMAPPYQPEFSSPTDTSNFDVDDMDLKPASSETQPPPPRSAHSAFSANHLPFIGFTFTLNSVLSDSGSSRLSSLVNQPAITSDNNVDKAGGDHNHVYERRVQRLEQEKAQLEKKLQESVNHTQASNNWNDNLDVEESKKLREEINFLHKKLAVADQELQAADVLRKDLEDVHQKLKALERTNRHLKQDKDEIHRDFVESRDRAKEQTRQLRDAHAQRRLAMEEFTDINDRLTEVQSQKNKLARQLREKEEEVDLIGNKLDQLRQDLRKTEKSKKNFEEESEKYKDDLAKQTKLRLSVSERLKQTEEEVALLRRKDAIDVDGRVNMNNSTYNQNEEEIERLQKELEQIEADHRLEISKRESLHITEVKNLKQESRESESQNISLQREIMILKDKVDKVRRESNQELQDTLKETRQKHERQTKILSDNNTALQSEIERVSAEMERLNQHNRTLEEEVREAKERKESIKQWEAQVAEIIQWVSDEKDARGYLQALAGKMTDEMDNLKSASARTNTMDKWQTQRRQKVDRQAILELQSNLQSEIQAKQNISEQLTRATESSIVSEKRLQDALSRIAELEMEKEKMEEQLLDAQKRTIPGDQALSLFPPHWAELDEDDRSFMTDTPRSPATDESRSLGSSEVALPTKRYQDPDKDECSSLSTHISEASHKPNAHRFVVKTFSSPMKCNHCSSLMVGLIRQGTTCDVCSFSCHVACAQKAPAVCPIPPDQAKRPTGIDPHRGIGTAYEGYVKIPKPMGVRKGWIKQLAVVCDFKLFLYDMSDGGRGVTSQPSVIASQVIDMRDEQFAVVPVTAVDVIHATKKELPCIFRVVASCMHRPVLRSQVLLLAESETAKSKWVGALSEVLRILRKHQLRDKSIYRPLETYDPTLPMIKSSMSASVIDQDRVALGTEEGLYVLEFRTDEIVKVGDAKKIYAIEVIPQEDMIAVISGRNRHIRLHSLSSLEGGDGEAIKIEESKGCNAVTSGPFRQGSTTCLCVAIKKHVFVYEMNNTKLRHKRIRDIMLPSPAQWLCVMNERLCAGYVSGFALFSIQGNGKPIPLMYYDDGSLAFLYQPPVDALCAVDVSTKECLLCFATCGVYVTWDGRRSRQQELMWPAPPTAIVYNRPYLVVYSENAIDIFDPASMEWLQTIPLKKVRPLSTDGSLNLACSMEPPKLVHLKNKYDEGDEIILPELLSVGRRQLIRKNKRRLLFKVPPEEHRSNLRTELLKNPERRRELISAPHNFNHVAHMGPGDGIQILKDLPVPAAPQSHSHDLISSPSNFNHVYHLGADAQREITKDKREIVRGSQSFHQETKVNQMFQQSSASVQQSQSLRSTRQTKSNQASVTTSPERSYSHRYNYHHHHGEFDREDSDSRISTASNKSSDMSSPPSPGYHSKVTLDSESGSWEA